MKFSNIIGNVPYQKESGGVRPKEIYSDFIIKSYGLNPRRISLIVPTRWYNGSTPGMHKVRELILNNYTSIIVDYPKADDIFDDTQISGGVCYWLWSKNKYVDECTVKHVINNSVSIFKEKLNSEIFIRYKQGLSILNKVNKLNEFRLNGTYGFWKTFVNIHINDRFKENGKIKFIAKDGYTSYLDEHDINTDMINLVPKYKVITGAMTPGGGIQKSDKYSVINVPRIIEPYEVFSDYYYILGVFDSLDEAKNFESYICTKFVRVLIQLINNTTSFNQTKFRYIPIQNWGESWSDDKLYIKYGLTQEEKEFIESLIKDIKQEKKLDKSDNKISDFSEFMNKPEGIDYEI